MVDLPINFLICSADILLACISTTSEHVMDFQVFYPETFDLILFLDCQHVE